MKLTQEGCHTDCFCYWGGGGGWHLSKWMFSAFHDNKFIYVYMCVCMDVHSFMMSHQMETFSTLLAICVGNSPVPGEFLTQRSVTQSFDVFFHLRLDKWLRKQSWGWWFETLLHPLWHHCNVSLIKPSKCMFELGCHCACRCYITCSAWPSAVLTTKFDLNFPKFHWILMISNLYSLIWSHYTRWPKRCCKILLCLSLSVKYMYHIITDNFSSGINSQLT